MDDTKKMFVLIQLLLLAKLFATTSNKIIVNTQNGLVKGKIIRNVNVTYYAYLGIPYAEPPVKDLRFMPPVPKSPWDGVLDATKYGPVCPQFDNRYNRNQMDEDCLNLNVFVPFEKDNALSPVMINAHGGEFIMLSGRPDIIYGPEFFLRHGIIVVGFNYRLGALGFLSTNTTEAPGNAGLKDSLLALQWVKANIAKFGGDPNKITFFGQSAGGVIVHYLTLSQKVNGLFQRAIMDSGSALSYRFLNPLPVKSALELSTMLGYYSSETKNVTDFLKNIDPFNIIDAQTKIGDNNKRNGFRPYRPYVPVIENESAHAIITKAPTEETRSGYTDNIPILLGFNNKEGIKQIPTIRDNPDLVTILNNNFELAIPSDIYYPYGSNESLQLATAIKEKYFNGANITNMTQEGYINLVTDTQISYSVDSFIKLYKETGENNKIYYYKFDFSGELNWYKVSSDLSIEGAAHTDELGYLFVTNATKPLLDNVEGRSERTLNVMQTLWTNFIKYGNPTPAGKMDHDIKVTWEECGINRDYILLNDRPRMMKGSPDKERLNFWYNVYKKYEEYVRDGGELEVKLP